MTTFTLLIILSLSLLLGLFLTHRFGAKISITAPNFASWYYIVEFFIMSAASCYTILYIYHTKWALNSIPKDKFPFQEVVFAFSWCAIAMPIGFIIANYILRKLNKEVDYNQFINRSLTEMKYERSFISFWLIISAIFSVFTIFKIGYIPHTKLFSLSGDEISLLRGNLTHHYPASNHLKELIGLHIIPILCYTSFVRMIKYKYSFKDVLVFLLFFFQTLFFASINLNKSGAVIALIGFIFGITILFKKIKLKYLIITVLSLFFMLSAAYKVSNKSSDLLSIANSIYGRTVHSQSFGNFLSFYIFPANHEHIGFRSISKQIRKLGFEYHEPASRVMMRHVNKDAVEKGTAGYMVSSFVAEAWANWGITGVVFAPLFVGFFIKFLIGLIISQPKTSISIGIICFLSFRVATFVGINHILFPRYILLSLLLFYLTSKVLNYFKMRQS